MHEALTPREAEVLDLLAKGMTNREIREALVIAESTVEHHVAKIAVKLNLETGARIGIVIRAIELGLVHVNHSHDWQEYRQCRTCGLVHEVDIPA